MSCGQVSPDRRERGLPQPELPDPEPFDGRAPEVVSLAGFDEVGFPIQVDGASTVVDGLYFVGVPFMRTRKSPLLLGVGEDAAVVARLITGRAGQA